MRYLTLLLSVTILGGACYFYVKPHPLIQETLTSFIPSSEFQTLEVRHSAEMIMNRYRNELLKDPHHTFLEPKIEFHPYLLMEVKYNRTRNTTAEGVILWSLTDGEMVIDARSWEKTHGFNDCIDVNASRNEFKIINALAQKGGKLDRDSLSKQLNLEGSTLDFLLDSCRNKSLVVQSGNIFRLHLQNPKLWVLPETRISECLVTKAAKDANKVSSKYKKLQIERTARAAFGDEFAIRKTSEIFLPVYNITVQNPDGSQMTTYWNALNGERIRAGG